LYLQKSHELANYKTVDSSDKIWGDFLNGSNENVIVCGDHYFYNLINATNGRSKRSIHIRDTWINSNEDLEYLIFPPAEYEVGPTDQTYFPHSSIWTLPGIVKVLNCSQREIVIRPSSKITPTLIEEENIIYTGNIKSLGILSHFLGQANLYYDIRDRLLFYKTGKDTTVFTTSSHEENFHKDYALIMKWRGPRGNSFLIITSFFTVGAKEAVRYMTETQQLDTVKQKLEESCGYVPDNFKMVMEVTGYHQAITESKFVLVESLDAQTFRNPFVETTLKN
jgi:hypothetical protein